MAAAKAPPAPEAPPAAPAGAPKRKTKNQKTLSKVKARFSFVAGIGGRSAAADGSTAENVGWWQGIKNAKRRISQQVRGDKGVLVRKPLEHGAALAGFEHHRVWEGHRGRTL